jgi:two-component system chemotaxis response regulator CheY
MKSLIVLVVDDADDCLAMLDVALQALPGVIVRSTHSAEAALEVLASGDVAAMITDIRLPAMTGIELIQRIRHDPGLRALPIVVISAEADPAVPRTALESGANAFFPKPFSPAAVRKKLEELIHAR